MGSHSGLPSALGCPAFLPAPTPSPLESQQQRMALCQIPITRPLSRDKSFLRARLITSALQDHLPFLDAVDLDLSHTPLSLPSRPTSLPSEHCLGGHPPLCRPQSMTGNTPNFTRDIQLHVQEEQSTPNRINSKKSRPALLIVKLLRTKDEIVKAAGEKLYLNCRGEAMGITVGFLSETTRARRKQHNILHALKEKSCEHRILMTVEERYIPTRESSGSQTCLQRMAEGKPIARREVVPEGLRLCS